ncbi:hypothetical protein JCGZ_17457 [Jatropha curcas]|uniref:Uncharacterized protein n=1 Tax=Jatropha curcas TaxID=180498 RepID=A0A067LK91_JATCU|nr:hypothetical protein JCGZ_17457 [Jatropha curcas]
MISQSTRGEDDSASWGLVGRSLESRRHRRPVAVASLAGIGIDSHFYSSRWRSVQREGRLGSSSAIGEQHFYTGLIDWDSLEVRKTSRRRERSPLRPVGLVAGNRIGRGRESMMSSAGEERNNKKKRKG